MTDFTDLPPDDQRAIGKTLLTLLRSFGDRDADALHADANTETTYAH